jgi:hypothetical protein
MPEKGRGRHLWHGRPAREYLKLHGQDAHATNAHDQAGHATYARRGRRIAPIQPHSVPLTAGIKIDVCASK